MSTSSLTRMRKLRLRPLHLLRFPKKVCLAIEKLLSFDTMTSNRVTYVVGPSDGDENVVAAPPEVCSIYINFLVQCRHNWLA